MKDFKVREYFMLSLKKNRNKENLHEINELIRPKKAVYFSFINNEIFNYRDKITIEQKICLFKAEEMSKFFGYEIWPTQLTQLESKGGFVSKKTTLSPFLMVCLLKIHLRFREDSEKLWFSSFCYDEPTSFWKISDNKGLLVFASIKNHRDVFQSHC